MNLPCIFSWSGFDEFWKNLPTASITISFFGNVVNNSFDRLKRKGWTEFSIESVTDYLLKYLSLALHDSMIGTPIQGWFDYIDKM